MAKIKKDTDLNKKKSQNKISQSGASKSQVKEKEKIEEITKDSILQSQELLIGNEDTSQSLLSGMVLNILFIIIIIIIIYDELFFLNNNIHII